MAPSATGHASPVHSNGNGNNHGHSNGHRHASSQPRFNGDGHFSSGPRTMLPVEHPTDSFWHTQPHELNDQRTTECLPEHSDIVIIGAGYAGVATAYNLVKNPASPSNLSITILEARHACSGATGRNGGHLRPDLYGHIPTYIKRFGLDAGAELAEFEIAHVQAIKKLVADEKIDCDFTLTRTCDVWTNQAAADKAKAVYDMMVAFGLSYMDDVDFTMGPSAEGLSGIKDAKACATYTAGTLWPYKFIMHLLTSAISTGKVNLQTHTPATEITASSSGGYNIQTSRGFIHARTVIHANNAYVSGLLPEYQASIIPCKGICCRITVPKNSTAPLVQSSYIVRTTDGKGLDYLIPRSDGSIVVGGASQTFKPSREQWYDNVDDSVLIQDAEGYYDEYMQRTFRGWDESGAKIDKIWTGVMGYSYDSAAHVGTVPSRDGQYILAGFNGHGMPLIWLAAKGIADMVLTGKSYETAGLPRVMKTSSDRIQAALNGREGGDILFTPQS